MTEPVTNPIANDLSWLRAHLILLVLVVVLVFAGVYGIESVVALHDQQREIKDNAVLTAIQANSTSLEQRIVQDEQASAQRDAQYQQIISGLTATIAQQNTKLAKQIKVNAALSPSDTAAAIATKTQAPVGAVTAQGATVQLSLDEAKKINDDLDTLVTVQKQLNETQSEVAAQTELTADAKDALAQEKALVANQQLEIDQQVKVCDAKIAVVNAKARKGKLKAAFWGFLAGLGVRSAL